jgi:3-phenylpropionate/cinnamic acid dioxygenase small subunit
MVSHIALDIPTQRGAIFRIQPWHLNSRDTQQALYIPHPTISLIYSESKSRLTPRPQNWLVRRSPTHPDT